MTGTSPPVVGARVATPEDRAQVDRLRHLAEEEVRSGRGGAALLAEHVVPDGALVLVGTIGPVVVGQLTLELVPAGPSRVAELYVEPEARGVGVGAALVALALERCRTAGSTSVDAEALPGDRATKNFFEAYGFVTRRLTVRRDLGPAD